MTARPTKKRSRIVRYRSLDEMPPPKPLSKAFKNMTDSEVERRAAADPDAGVIPHGFWDNAAVILPETKQQITLRLDPEVIHVQRLPSLAGARRTEIRPAMFF